MLEPIAAPRASTDKTAVASRDIVVYSIPPNSKGELANPVYPPEALAARAGSHDVFVTITVDRAGSVTDVVPSWQRMNIPGRYSAAFLEAARAAASTWRFVPARHEYWRKSADGNLTYMYAETISAMFDVKFTFDASGAVR
jgi:outer membrane biosynthesis protein TonB